STVTEDFLTRTHVGADSIHKYYSFLQEPLHFHLFSQMFLSLISLCGQSSWTAKLGSGGKHNNRNPYLSIIYILYVLRMEPKKWTYAVSVWEPRLGKRKVGKQKKSEVVKLESILKLVWR
ncbi:hypothetical protein L9F63_023103, partial [Diploptera punctata]